MSLDLNSPIHHRIILLACVLPLLGFLSGKPTAMVITLLIAGVIAMPYFAVLAQAENDEQEGEK